MYANDEIMEYIIESENRIAYAYYISEADEPGSPAEEGAISKALNAIKSAIQALIEKVKEILSNIGNFFTNGGFDSPEQKRKYELFKKYVASHPQLGNVKVSIRDFKKYEEVYDKYIKEIDKKLNSDTDVSQDELDKLADKLKNEIKGVANIYSSAGGRAVGTVALNKALAIADRNALAASALKKLFEDEKGVMEAFGGSLSAKEIKKSKKKIARYAKNGRLHRLKLFILGRKKDTLQDILKDTGKLMKDFVKFDENGNFSVPNAVLGAVKHPVITAKTVFGKNAEGKRPVMDAAKFTRKTKEQIKQTAKFFGVDDLGNSLKRKKDK